MKKQIAILVIIVACTTISAPPGDLGFIHNLAEMKQTTFNDAVQFFSLTIFKQSYTFKQNLSMLQRKGIAKGMNYKYNAPLTKGMICLMAARYNKLSDSLLYMIFKTERYAFRVCASHRIVKYEGSEWDPISGEELIEIMNRTIILKDKKEIK
jgi:hypothetical protein